MYLLNFTKIRNITIMTIYVLHINLVTVNNFKQCLSLIYLTLFYNQCLYQTLNIHFKRLSMQLIVLNLKYTLIV